MKLPDEDFDQLLHIVVGKKIIELLHTSFAHIFRLHQSCRVSTTLAMRVYCLVWLIEFMDKFCQAIRKSLMLKIDHDLMS